MTEKELKKNFPSIDLAYAIAIDSYELFVKRVDALGSRLQNMLTFSMTLLVAVPTIAKLREISFDSGLVRIGYLLSFIFNRPCLLREIYGKHKDSKGKETRTTYI